MAIMGLNTVSSYGTRSSLRMLQRSFNINTQALSRVPNTRLTLDEGHYSYAQSLSQLEGRESSILSTELTRLNDQNLIDQSKQNRFDAFVNLLTTIRDKTKLASESSDHLVRAGLQREVQDLWLQAENIVLDDTQLGGKMFEGVDLDPILINGTAADDTLEGTFHADEIYGYDGDDTLIGGYGNDFIYTGGGEDTVDAGAGDDYIKIDKDAGRAVYDPSQPIRFLPVNMMSAGEGDDYIDGSTAIRWNNLLVGDEGADTIIGSATQDHIILGDPYAVYEDRALDDYINYGTEYARGGDAIDVIYGGGSNDIIFGEEGRDKLSGGRGDDTIIAGDATDNFDDVAAGSERELSYGGYGDDTIYASARSGSELYGEQGSDTLILKEGEYQRAYGGIGDDIIYGGDAYFQLLFSEEGNDTLYAGTGERQYLFGNDGDDTLYGGSGYNQRIYGGDGNDTLYTGYRTSTQGYYGNDGNDIINGNQGTNLYLDGGNDDDIIYELTNGGHTISGGDGDDIILSESSKVGGGNGDDIIIITGTFQSGSITGHDGDDILFMNDSNRWAWGGAGNDTIIGGTRYAIGDSGDDVFYDNDDSNSTIFGAAHVGTGGAGVDQDVYVLSGNFSDYVINDTIGGQGTITDTRTGRVNTYNDLEYLQFQDGYVDLASDTSTLIAGKAPTTLDFALERPDWKDVIVDGQNADDFVASHNAALPLVPFDASITVRPDVNAVFPTAPSYQPTQGLQSLESTSQGPVFQMRWAGPLGDWENDVSTIDDQLVLIEDALTQAASYSNILDSRVTTNDVRIEQLEKLIEQRQTSSVEIIAADTNENAVNAQLSQINLELAAKSYKIIQDSYYSNLLQLMNSISRQE